MSKRFLTYFIAIFGGLWTILEAFGFFFESSWAQTIKGWNDGAGFWILFVVSGLLALLGIQIQDKVYDHQDLENVADNPQNKQQKIEKKANSVPSTSSSLKTVKIQALEKRLTKLLAEYEFVSQQLSNALSEANRVRLNGQLEMLEKEISRLEGELNSLK